MFTYDFDVRPLMMKVNFKTYLQNYNKVDIFNGVSLSLNFKNIKIIIWKSIILVLLKTRYLELCIINNDNNNNKCQLEL